ncbi:regulatory factor X-associated protein [Sapajus apella]|uniref:Regulatory factor X-associated protein n=1 Tax=Sapajus apella TaxID=9515 RepID=A0A6J3J5U2_SAPAP|nr:regulatory factor X-associated protein [Sapajus apella]
MDCELVAPGCDTTTSQLQISLAGRLGTNNTIGSGKTALPCQPLQGYTLTQPPRSHLRIPRLAEVDGAAAAQSVAPGVCSAPPPEAPRSLTASGRPHADAQAAAWQVLKPRGRGPRPGASSTEAQDVAEGTGSGAASGVPHPAALAPAAAPTLAPAPVAAAASQFTLLVMQPCAGQDEAAAPGGSVGSGKPVRYLCEGVGDGEEETGEDEADLLDTSDPPGGGESAASLEDLEDEETHSGGEGSSGGAQRRGSGGGSMSKTCTYEGCSETTSQVAKQRKPWMCKKHRNKMYKDKYKKKKSDQALNCSGTASTSSAGNVKLEESADNILSIVKQRTGSFGDRPARPTLLEQVLNQKRLSLLRSPEVVQFLQKQQQLLNQQVLEQRQQQFPGASI